MAATTPASARLIRAPRISAPAVEVAVGGRLRSAVRMVFCAASLLLSAQLVQAQTATQVVTFSVIRAARTAMMASATTFNVPSLNTAGNSTRAAITGSSYAFSTNEANQKIAASLDAPMPRGVSLAAALTPPVGAWSTGVTPLGNTARDVVGGVSQSSADALSLQYTLTSRTDVPRSALRTSVTFTITGGV